MEEEFDTQSADKQKGREFNNVSIVYKGVYADLELVEAKIACLEAEKAEKASSVSNPRQTKACYPSMQSMRKSELIGFSKPWV